MPVQRWVSEARADRVADLRRAVVNYAAQHGFGNSALPGIAVGVSEVLTTVVLYARQTGAATDIEVRAEVAEHDELVVRVCGAGLAGPSENAPQVGLGMMIASAFAHSIDMRHTSSGAAEVGIVFKQKASPTRQ